MGTAAPLYCGGGSRRVCGARQRPGEVRALWHRRADDTGRALGTSERLRRLIPAIVEEEPKPSHTRIAQICERTPDSRASPRWPAAPLGMASHSAPRAPLSTERLHAPQGLGGAEPAAAARVSGADRARAPPPPHGSAPRCSDSPPGPGLVQGDRSPAQTLSLKAPCGLPAGTQGSPGGALVHAELRAWLSSYPAFFGMTT